MNGDGRPRRSVAFAAANCAGARVTLILSATKARATPGLQGGEAADQPRRPEGIFGAGVCLAHVPKLCTPGGGSLCPVEGYPHPDDGVAEKRLSVDKCVEGSEGARLIARGGFHWGRQGEARREDRHVDRLGGQRCWLAAGRRAHGKGYRRGGGALAPPAGQPLSR